MNTLDIISLHPGKQHNLEQAEQLAKHFSSFRHITSFVVSHEKLKKYKFMPKAVIKELQKRCVNEKLAAKTEIFPNYEILYKFRRVFNKSLPYGEFFLKRNVYFQRQFLRKYNPPGIFIGFDNSSALIFEKWKGKSTLILDLTIAIPQFKKRLAEDYNLPQTAIDNLTNLDSVWYSSYETELTLADYILCGSEFVKKSCLYYGLPERKLVVIPYGADLKKFTPKTLPKHREDIPVRIAFVGNVSYRKGADVLLRAWDDIVTKYDNVELHFFGNLQIDISKYNLAKVFFHGFIVHEELVEHLSECHISILPTFFEGSSIAIYQSMSLGLAVVTTHNSGSIVNHMHNGIIINYGSESEIIDALTLLIEHKELRLNLSERAMEDIRDYSWDNYGNRLQKFLLQIKE